MFVYFHFCPIKEKYTKICPHTLITEVLSGLVDTGLCPSVVDDCCWLPFLVYKNKKKSLNSWEPDVVEIARVIRYQRDRTKYTYQDSKPSTNIHVFTLYC